MISFFKMPHYFDALWRADEERVTIGIERDYHAQRTACLRAGRRHMLYLTPRERIARSFVGRWAF